MIRNVAVIGATGSIGTNTLDIIDHHPDRFRASVLVADRDIEALAAQCVRHRPDLAIVADTTLETMLTRRLAALGVRCDVDSGPAAIHEAVTSGRCDTVVAAIDGLPGIDSTLAAARAGKRLLLANKASTVMAGPLLLQALADGRGELIPVDQTQNAIFQCLSEGRRDPYKGHVKRLILTGSGGPFRGLRRPDLMTVEPEQICKHPSDAMRRKASVDSATLMDMGLALIEAHHLFQAPPEQLDVRLPLQGQIHGLVEYADGSALAQQGHPDIRTAIFGALVWPERAEVDVTPLDLTSSASLAFEKPDTDTLRCLALALQALRTGGDAAAILNAANDVAVEAFLAGSLPFLSIADLIEQVLTELPAEPVVDIQTLSERDRAARAAARQVLRNAC